MNNITWDEFKIAREAFLNSCNGYAAWFTWYFTVSLTAFGVIIALRRDNMRLCAMLTSILFATNISAVAYTISMQTYVTNAFLLMRKLIPANQHENALWVIMGENHSNFSMMSALFVLLVSLVGWIYFFIDTMLTLRKQRRESRMALDHDQDATT